jgi:amidase
MLPTNGSYQIQIIQEIRNQWCKSRMSQVNEYVDSNGATTIGAVTLERQPQTRDPVSRRVFLATAAATLGGVCIRPQRAEAQPPELTQMSASKLAELIRQKKVSSFEVVKAHLDRLAEVNPRINAVVAIAPNAIARAKEADAHLARGKVLGPLHGVPVTVKDCLMTRGLRTANGSLLLRDHVRDIDAMVVIRLTRAGAIIIGKTNMPELGLGYETDNLLDGRTNNPYDLSRTPGGSSGGEAAAIAATASSLGLGSDWGGGIRLPAHFCGIAGLKPTSGRVPIGDHLNGPALILYPHAAIGPLGRTVEDLNLALLVIADAIPNPANALAPKQVWEVETRTLRDPRDVRTKPLRIAYFTDNGIVTPVPAIRDAVERAARVLDQHTVAHVEEKRPPQIEQTSVLYWGLQAPSHLRDLQRTLHAYPRATGSDVPIDKHHPIVTQLNAQLERVARELLSTRAQRSMLAIKRLDFDLAMQTFIDTYDVILSPANAFPAMKHGTTMAQLGSFSYTQTFNLTGWPAAVVPVGRSAEGLPVGVQIVTRPWREDVALAVAGLLEEQLGGWQAPPL